MDHQAQQQKEKSLEMFLEISTVNRFFEFSHDYFYEMSGQSEYTDDELKLMRAVYRGEPFVTKPVGTPVSRDYKPIFKHPLPVSERRYFFESQLRRILTFKGKEQALAAVTLQNAWALEEVLMRGAPYNTRDASDYTPLHVACSQNDFESVMVLINFGADMNAETINGMTPLYMARAAGATQVVELLQSRNARMEPAHKNIPGKTILEQNRIESKNGILHMKGDCVGLPHDHTMF